MHGKKFGIKGLNLNIRNPKLCLRLYFFGSIFIIQIPLRSPLVDRQRNLKSNNFNAQQLKIRSPLYTSIKR